jgi:hypothetical protein
VPQRAGRGFHAGARSAGFGVGGEREAVREDQRACLGRLAVWLIARAGGARAAGVAGADVTERHRVADRGQAAGQADLLQGRDIPALGRVDRDSHRAGARPADLAADEQQPGAEQPRRAPVLH